MGLLDEYDYSEPPVNMGLLSDTLTNYAKNVVTGQYARRGLLDFANTAQAAMTGDTQAAIDLGLNFNPMSALAIKAFHGSPYKFDKFKLDKIGTGEGAQAYGHGLYFAENPGVAKEYAENLGMGKPTLYGKPFDEALGASRLSDKAKEIIQFDIGNATKSLDGMARIENFARQGHPEYVEAWDFLKKAGVTPNRGNMYSVELEHPASQLKAGKSPLSPEDLLDWDKPLSQQPAVLEKLRKLAKLPEFKHGMLAESLQPFELNNTTGQAIHGVLDTYFQGDRVKVSGILKRLGIPGIKYLDQGSRSAGQGTSNFVIFDDELVKILGRE